MLKDKYLSVIDFGSSELRLGIFNEKLSKLFFQSKKILQKNNYQEYSESINLLIKEAENKISTHLDNLTVLYDSPNIYTIDLTIKKKLDQKITVKNFCSSIILEANQQIKDCYTNKKIIHSIIKKYIINDKEFLNIPEELIEINSAIIEIKFICLPYNEYLDVIETFKSSNLKVINFFSSSLVKSFKYNNSFKENNSVAFLDIGLNRTTAIFFNNQKLEFLKSISIGGNHISKDISQVMKLSIDDSENLKKTFNKSEIDFSYNETILRDSDDKIKKIVGKDISVDLLKKVVLARIEEIIKLSFKDINFSESIDKKQNLNLVLIGNGSKIFNKNSFQLEDKYNFKEINFYEENDHEVCEAGVIFRESFEDINQAKSKKSKKKIGFFHRFFNIFGND